MIPAKPCHLDLKGEIARGAAGVVYRVRDPELEDIGIKEPTVLKEISHIQVLDDLEIDVLFRLRHPNLLHGLRLYLPPTGDACFEQDQAGVVLPKMERSAADYLSENSDWNQRLGVFMQICEGVRFLHANQVAHLDLKLENILLKTVETGNGGSSQYAVVGDFGLSRLMGTRKTLVSDQLLVTVTTRPVENLAGSRVFGYQSDIWSLGVIGLELLSQTRPFTSPSFFLGMLAAYRALIRTELLVDPKYWTADLIGTISNESTGQYRQLIKRYGLDFLVENEGKRSAWFDPFKRRQLINRLVGNDTMGGILMSMLAIEPLARPSIDDICVAIGATPVKGFVVPASPVTINERSIQILDGYFNEILTRDFLSRDFISTGVLPPTAKDAIGQARSLFLRCASFTMTNRSAVFLTAMACLWIFTKMYGYGIGVQDSLILRTRQIEPWDLALTRNQRWPLQPWTPGQPLIPSSLLVMERLIVQSLMGILV